MNFAWTDCCDWDSSLLSDCKLPFGLGPSHGSLLYLMDNIASELKGDNCANVFVAYAITLLIWKSTGKLTGY